MSRPPELTAASVIRLRREGGLAYIPGLTCPRFIHCSRYSEAQRDELRQLLSSLHETAAGTAAGTPVADRRCFCLSVEGADGGSIWSLTVAEEAMPPRLLEWWRRADRAAENGGAP